LRGWSDRTGSSHCGAVAAVPWRAHRAEAALLGGPATEQAFAAAAVAELAAARPLRDNGYEPHDVILRADRPRMYAPDHVNPNYVTDTASGDTASGDVEAALAQAAFRVDETYSTPAEHNNPMEPHAAIARWDGDNLTVWDSNQGPAVVQQALARLFRLDTGAVRVITSMLAAASAPRAPRARAPPCGRRWRRTLGRPVRVTFSRQQQVCLVGYRTPTTQRVRLGADAEGHPALDAGAGRVPRLVRARVRDGRAGAWVRH
jgi:xanthine dehydrogenase YagR molybdenum-binding subunit